MNHGYTSMARPKVRVPHVKFVKRGGKHYPYFDTGKRRGDRKVYARLPFYDTPGFWDSYNVLKAHRDRDEGPTNIITVDELLRRYEASAKFKGLAVKTQTAYSHAFKHIRKAFGGAEAEDLKPKDVRTFQSVSTPATGNLVAAVIRAAYAWGREYELVTVDPCKEVKSQETGSHEPWDDDTLNAALESEDRLIRLAVHLLFYTGQRIGDVCNLRWSNVRNGHVSLVQQKTRKPLTIPLHSALAAELSATPKAALTILATDEGRPISDQVLRKHLKKFTDDKFVPHGLRKNAVISLLEAGCTHKEVQSITGQSLQMIEYYAARLDQPKVAGGAVLKWEGTHRERANSGKTLAESGGK
jgi:integrase